MTRIYEVFPLARYVDSLISRDNVFGFVIFQAVLVAFGWWCWAFPLRLGWYTGRGFVWFWIIIELGNGIGHLLVTLVRGHYTSGTATAPLVLVFAIWLWVLDRQWAHRRRLAPMS